MTILEKTTCQLLRDTADKIEKGSCIVTDETMEMAQKMLGHHPLSKEQACNYLHMSRSNFDLKIQHGLLPRGRKVSGFTGLVWYQDELEEISLN